MKVCFDANVIIDLFAKTEEVGNAVFSYDIAAIRGFDLFAPTSALSDIAYVLHRYGLSRREVSSSMQALLELFECIDVNGTDAKRVLANGMRDFEDAIIAESCSRNEIDLIITRNLKDFKRSSIPAMSPGEFVRTYKPANDNSAEIEF